MHAVAGVAVQDMQRDPLGHGGCSVERDGACTSPILRTPFQFARVAMIRCLFERGIASSTGVGRRFLYWWLELGER
jgi:hypothetical protein